MMAQIHPAQIHGSSRDAPSNLKVWQELSLVVSKTMTVYCGMSLVTLCLLSWLILNGTAGDEWKDVKASILPEGMMNFEGHPHDLDFYAFILTLLICLRGLLLYMANALKRPVQQKDSSAVRAWLLAALCILISESVLGLSLLECLPHVLILVFLFVEIIVQAAFMWIVWNFNLEMMMTAAATSTTA